jgi:hypothetical protein
VSGSSAEDVPPSAATSASSLVSLPTRGGNQVSFFVLSLFYKY